MSDVRPRRAVLRALAASAVLPLLLTACGYGSQRVDDTTSPAAAQGPRTDGLDEVRIGFFANVTHATALVGLSRDGLVQKELGGTAVKPQVFNAGPAAIEALNADAVDMTWIGPSPAINGFTRAGGRNLRIVSGATSGGASLVVDPDRISSVDDLKGKRIATPQIGNTQDVALLNYLADKGLKVDADTGRGDVSVVRQDNKEIPTTFQQGGLDGAWVPEPTASNIVAKGGKVLLDEKELWDGGKFVTTHLVVSQKFLAAHPKVVEAVLRGTVGTNTWIKDNPDEAKKVLNAQLEQYGGQPLPEKVLDPAFAAIEVTDDPLASTLRAQAEHSVASGLLKEARTDGIYDLSLLNKVLKAEGRDPVDDAGLGAE
ncbi:ABC transporter substrate-binding protein [Streptomyces sp. 549]|uniref:ABC transporter substrate-binding protein n=1 Tax=Streptomyces sp. 549 TaxID=3049076 RepID=UPI0024C2A0D2|nr:ABC transporter substrate-binding protein [Streptomyces sp. 549]MDK1475223.1 ABC transporter substrate-binding protein [Streptomyces sp. 549]